MEIDFSATQVMGILNVTPDSFSDGGRYSARDAALRQAEKMLREGAAIIDVGGESTRPGAEPVAIEDELERVLPVVESLVDELGANVSVDTSKPAVMRAAIDAGAVMINDVLALRESGAVEVIAANNVSVCLMHMQGLPRTMQTDPQYDDVVADIIRFLDSRLDACTKAGIDRRRIVLDPGFGFGKSLAHNYEILARLDEFSALGCPLLVGMSRKSMIGNLLDLPVPERATASAILAALALERGANILRVHDVKQTMQAIRLVEALQHMRES